MSRYWSVILILVGLLIPSIALANAMGCVNDRIASIESEGEVLSLASGEAEQLIAEIAASIGLSTTGIRVIECFDVRKAATVPPEISGHYIVYNPDWIREVMGRDRWQIVAIFAHELGHYVDGHYSWNRDLSRFEKEAAADSFAGCAVARQGGPWSALEDLFTRIRREKDLEYPNRVQSLERLREGFSRCGGIIDDSVNRADIQIGNMTLEFESGSGFGYVYLGKFIYGSWQKVNFFLPVDASPNELIGSKLSAGPNVNVRGSLPISGSQMGPIIGGLATGDRVEILGTHTYGGRDLGHTWAQVRLQ